MAVVTRRTGLGADVIRAWERRYQAITPDRSAGNHRLYSDDDIRRLLLIRRALECGWQIGQIAGLTDAEIAELIEAVESVDAELSGDGRQVEPPEALLRRCLLRIKEMDGDGLRRELEDAAVELGRTQVLEGLLAPLMERIGDGYTDGSLRIAHEHLASTALRAFLDSVQGAYPVSERAPSVIVTTPSSQHHELSAMLVAATARSEGWRVVYLGPNLPAEEIAAAVVEPNSRVLALSITYDTNDPDLDAELRRIGRLVRDEVSIVVGGQAAAGYLAALNEIGATRITDLGDFRAYLRNERGRA
jgi:DNA-binding transcriptional MerR regulator/methylmalonyl-CoA mutase cobalamin-binding subunit